MTAGFNAVINAAAHFGASDPPWQRAAAIDIVLISRAFPMGTAGLEPATSRV